MNALADFSNRKIGQALGSHRTLDSFVSLPFPGSPSPDFATEPKKLIFDILRFFPGLIILFR